MQYRTTVGCVNEGCDEMTSVIRIIQDDSPAECMKCYFERKHQEEIPLDELIGMKRRAKKIEYYNNMMLC